MTPTPLEEATLAGRRLLLKREAEPPIPFQSIETARISSVIEALELRAAVEMVGDAAEIFHAAKRDVLRNGRRSKHH